MTVPSDDRHGERRRSRPRGFAGQGPSASVDVARRTSAASPVSRRRRITAEFLPLRQGNPGAGVISALYFAVRLCLRCAPLPDLKFGARTMSDHDQRRRGQSSRYLNGGTNALMRAPAQRGDELQGGWSREQLMKMDARFVAAVARAIARGKETGGGPDYPGRISRPPRRLRLP